VSERVSSSASTLSRVSLFANSKQATAPWAPDHAKAVQTGCHQHRECGYPRWLVWRVRI
jgi:hypothetical protein